MLRPLAAHDLLRAWEVGLSQPPPQRALTLLALACSDALPNGLAQLSIGRRDARLLTLREQTFGPQVVAVATCPACQEPMELDFQTTDIQLETSASLVDSLCMEVEGYHVAFRLPDSTDLLALYETGAKIDGLRYLLQRCLLSVEYEGQAVSDGDLPAAVIAAVNEVMGQIDSQADIRLALNCPACEHSWLAPFDVLSFFWLELTAWAQRLLQEVHGLATAYGWSERDILALTARRRRLYLEMIVQ